LLNDLDREAFFIYVGDPLNRKYYLNIEGYFKLLDYKELNNARKSSKETRRHAIVAITLSIITLAISIYFSNMELKQKTTINNRQFKAIENICII